MQILLPGETEDGEMMNNDEHPTFEPMTTSTVEITANPVGSSPVAEGKSANKNMVDRNHLHSRPHNQPSAVIELTPMTYSSVTSDTCPQCSSSAAKTSFMTFDELADAIIISGANNPSAAAVTNC